MSRQSGFEVIDLPLLELKPRPFTQQLKQLYSQLLDTQLIVVVSPTAVHIGMQYLQQAGVLIEQIKHIQWIAVGKKQLKPWRNITYRVMYLKWKVRKAC
jgi:uroporphyrinogen-III synthase